MKISHSWLQEYFKDTLPTAESLAELFTFHSFEIEGIEEKNSDKIIDAKILPDRAHFCLSYRGIAEEVRVLTGLMEADNSDITVTIDESIKKVEVTIEAKDFCRRYVSRRINNVTITESPEKIKTMLAAMDGRSINRIVDATNLAMFDYGQPLHAFDADKVKGDIVVRAAKEGEVIMLLDGKEVTLTSFDHVIADDDGPLAIAGVKGGKRAEVTMSTKNLIIESAHFHPTVVRKTSTKYNLRNESSKRFENEITPEFAMDGMTRVSTFIHKLSPEAVFGPISDLYLSPLTKIIIVTSAHFICEKLGIVIPSERIKEILKSLSIEIVEKGTDLILTIPYHRLDLTIPEDIVEEVGRIYGYDKIEGTKQMPKETVVAAHPVFYVTERIKNILWIKASLKCISNSLVNKGDFEVAYPLASDKKALRTNLSEGMQKALEINARNADFLFLDSIKIFEIGRVFTEKGEHTSLCVGIKRVKKVKGQTSNEDIRQLREHLLKILNVDIMTLCTVDDTGGIMRFNGKEIGVINNLDGIMELNLDELISHLEVPQYASIGFGPAIQTKYVPFSTYPFIVRDIAVFVLDTVMPQEIEKIITSNGSELLIKNQLFDTFQKDSKISYAFRMIFQSYERTLTDDEVNGLMDTIAQEVMKKGWEVR